MQRERHLQCVGRVRNVEDQVPVVEVSEVAIKVKVFIAEAFKDALSWKRRQTGNLSKTASFSELNGRWRKIAVCKGRTRRSETISGVAEVMLLLWKYGLPSARQ